jgi:hypothetical protein
MAPLDALGAVIPALGGGEPAGHLGQGGGLVTVAPLPAVVPTMKSYGGRARELPVLYHIDAVADRERVLRQAQGPSRCGVSATDEDRITVWRDVLATTNGAKIKARRQPSRPSPPSGASRIPDARVLRPLPR